MSLRKIYYRLSPAWRLRARKLVYAPLDLVNSLLNKRSKYEPPKGDIYIGSGDFIAQGKRQLKYLQQYLGLQDTDAVLDIGSGIGRTAVALTSYLSPAARYEGFDVVEKGVGWCNKKIKADFPQFNFSYVALHNDLYNLETQKAASFQFPYPSQSFQKAFLFSVFTHMQPDEIQHYLTEINRVLKPGGACLATFFIYDDTTEESISSNPSFTFPVKREGFRLMHQEVPSANIALSESLLNSMIQKSGLRVKQKIAGYWRNADLKNGDNDFQDMLVLVK